MIEDQPYRTPTSEGRDFGNFLAGLGQRVGVLERMADRAGGGSGGGGGGGAPTGDVFYALKGLTDGVIAARTTVASITVPAATYKRVMISRFRAVHGPARGYIAVNGTPSIGSQPTVGLWTEVHRYDVVNAGDSPVMSAVLDPATPNGSITYGGDITFQGLEVLAFPFGAGPKGDTGPAGPAGPASGGRGVHSAAWLAPGYALTAGGAVAPGVLPAPYTEAGRLYEVTVECPALDPTGFQPGLLIVGPRIGGVNLWATDLHLFIGAGYAGFQMARKFHSGIGGNDIGVALRTSSTMKLGVLGMRVVLTDLGPSDKATREPA